MIYSKAQLFKTTGFLVIITLIAGILNTGCEDNNPTESEEEDLDGAEVVTEPQDVSFEVDEQQEFSAFVISAGGDTLNEDFDFTWNWYSSDAYVFTVETNGTVYGKSGGEAYCVVESETASGKVAAKMRFVGRDSAFVSIF